MRARFIALAAVSAVLVLAGCTGGQEEAPESAPAAVTTTEEPTQAERTPDPDAPENSVISDDDVLGHRACELWTSTLDDVDELAGVVEDVDWHSQHADNDFMSWSFNDGWADKKPGNVSIFCGWNGYEVEDGSPADLLG